MVPWVCLSGEAIESICSTFIGRLHKDATRIRPSQGDGGIDMEETNADGTLTVYQIKKFATNLSSSQKGQIKDSWEQVLDTVSERGKALKEWHLVMPLDPTPENKAWFDGLVEGSGVHAVWDGLSKVEGWAAKMPEVVDYYVHDGYERIMGMVQAHLAAIGVSGTVDSSEIHRRLEALSSILESQDPHYSYSISLLSDDDNRGRELRSQPHLVMSGLWDDGNGHCYRIDVFARYAAASDFAPIRGTMTLSPKDDLQRQQIRDFIDYGIPFEDIPGTLEETGGSLIPMPNDSDMEGFLSSFLPVEPQGEDPTLLLVADDGTELWLYRKMHSSGMRGGWVLLTDKSEMIECSMRVESAGQTKWSISCKLGPSVGKGCDVVLSCLEFVRAANACEGFTAICGNTSLLTVNQRFSSLGDDLLAELITRVEALVTVGQKVGRDIPMPDLMAVSQRDWEEVLLAGGLLKAGAMRRRVDNIRFSQSSVDLTTMRVPATIRWVNPLTVSFSGSSYDIGLIERYYPVKRVERGDHEDEYVFYPPEGVHYLAAFVPDSIAAAAQQKGQYWVDPFDPDMWQSWIEEIECL